MEERGRTHMIAIRWSTDADCERLAALHREAWRNAYAGIIPGLTLERMIGRRGQAWWRRMHRLGARALVLEFDGELAGYATLGPSRGGPGPGSGEITRSTSAPTARASASAAGCSAPPATA